MTYKELLLDMLSRLDADPSIGDRQVLASWGFGSPVIKGLVLSPALMSNKLGILFKLDFASTISPNRRTE